MRVEFVDRTRAIRANTLRQLVRDDAAPNVAYLTLHGLTTTLPEKSATPFASIDAEVTAGNSVEFDAPIDLPRSEERAAGSLRGALELTLERLLAGSTRVAVLAGGGLDSGGLLALVSDWARRRGRDCFAVAVDYEARGDDRPYLRALERRLHCHVERIAPEEGARFESTFRRGVDCAPMPWPSSFFELAAYARAKELRADRVLTGIGGDALFDGNPRSLARVARSGRPLDALRRVSRLRGFVRPRSPALTWLARPLLADLLPAKLRGRVVRTAELEVPEWFAPAALRIFGDESRRRRRELLSPPGLENSSSRLDDLLARHRHQVAEETGIARLDPFVDPWLQRFVRALPAQWLLQGDTRRGLFRDALKDLLPTELYQREDKASFEPALLRYVRAVGGFEALRPIAQVQTLSSLGLINASSFRRAFDRLEAHPLHGRHWTAVWPVLAIEAFAERFFAARPRRP